MTFKRQTVAALIVVMSLVMIVSFLLMTEGTRAASDTPVPLPKEIAKIKPDKVAIVEQSVRPWFPKAAIGKVDEADCWLAVKADSAWKLYDPNVVYCSAPGFQFEDMAKMVASLTIISPVKGYKPSKPSTLYLLVSFSMISSDEVFDSLPKPEQLLKIESPVRMISSQPRPTQLRGLRIDDYADGNPVLKILVNEGGMARRIRFAVPSGVGAPDSMAVIQARSTTYRPAMSGGKPIASWVTWPFTVQGSRYR